MALAPRAGGKRQREVLAVPERAHTSGSRATTPCRKDHYGSRSKRGSEVGALFHTLLETAKLSQVDPRCDVTLPADI